MPGTMAEHVPVDQPGVSDHSWSLEPPVMTPRSVEFSQAMANEACNSWTASGVLSPTVSAARLGVPGKASGEYQKGCGAFRDKKYDEAKTHLRRALEAYPDYVSAWVVLGQTLSALEKWDDSRDACTHASTVDPNYVPPYICLASLAATQDDWDKVAEASSHALALDPINNPYSLYYSADAAFHLKKLAEAERTALDGVKADRDHHVPELHTLLAQIYKANGDSKAQAAQLREYLKVSPNAPDAPGVKRTLAELSAQSPAH